MTMKNRNFVFSSLVSVDASNIFNNHDKTS